MRVVPVPVRSDNYAYLLIDDATRVAAAVDPYDPAAVVAAAEREQAVLGGHLITTHHHQDHSGGNAEFVRRFSRCKVYAGSDRSAGLTDRVEGGTTFRIGDNIDVRCVATPCHTRDSICFFVEDRATGQRGVFTGDTLFVAGCGRFFEGTAAEMHAALNSQLAALPDDTVTYVGHEYTKSNVAFASAVEPDNPDIQSLERYCQSNAVTTGKFTIGDEKKHNVFMRLNEPAVAGAAKAKGEVQVMEALREMKNAFKG